ncbi:polysaccharide pyruvyl transferase family protein [Photobacterium ganghwense]|uniref:polysaccharide pyruvyl transferase family protein n=1 Tax=Photobacterium ganghwense TaxID=320778 RepID=UPI001A909524|nr:polysaccharide pyruvyl transferase family protein [Photobacterium ganghwense]QSV13331.1 polysaccharide pyruvyl transferase family protein [Photobacterium ganghwense]
MYQNRSQHTERFILENIQTTQKINHKDHLSFIKYYNFDAFVVGSDQVWRPAYNSSLSTFFLDFLDENDTDTKRISYAASFGVDHCNEYSQEEIIKYSRLLEKFDLVSVREDSAVNLCNDVFKVKAHHVIDPTLLLSQNDYQELINKDSLNLSENEGDLMVYVLDKSESKKLIIDTISNRLSLSPFTVMAHSENDVFPPVTKWLKGFSDSKFVITDSFHGVAFSILFNKQFIAIGNKGRGLARFLSILKLFNLENRLIHSVEGLEKVDLSTQIDYKIVNEILDKERIKASKLINSSLN